MRLKAVRKIVLTGGPGGGKSTAAFLLKRELGSKIIIVPEAATALYATGFPRSEKPETLKQSQRVIFELQQGMEESYATEYPKHLLLCDRGTPDGAVFWPDGISDFFRAMGTSLERELARYDAVIFLETAAAGGLDIKGGNPFRTENLAEALTLDQRLKEIWSKHPRFHFVAHDASFLAKITHALKIIRSLTAKNASKVA